MHYMLLFTLFVFLVVLCALYCQFLWIVHFLLPLRFSLMFISNSGIHGNTVVDQDNKDRSDDPVCKHPIPFSDIKTFIL